eukprot:9103678-Karenia_brevis.AAC.1
MSGLGPNMRGSFGVFGAGLGLAVLDPSGLSLGARGFGVTYLEPAGSLAGSLEPDPSLSTLLLTWRPSFDLT